MSVLEAIREERDELLAPILHRLTHLAELERLELAHLGHDPAPEPGVIPEAEQPLLPAAPDPSLKQDPPAAPARQTPRSAPKAKRAAAAAEPKRADGLGPSKGKILDVVLSRGGPVTVAEIAEETDLTVTAVRAAVTTLVSNGQVVARGATSSRRYYSPARALEVDAQPNGSTAKTPTRALGERVMVPEQLKRDIRNLVARNPGQLNSADIAQGLGQPLADIARACGELVNERAIAAATNGCYRIAVDDGEPTFAGLT